MRASSRSASRSLGEELFERLWSALQGDDGARCRGRPDRHVEAPDRLTVAEAKARRVYKQEKRVYKQEKCRECGRAETVSEFGGRTAYPCPVEQPA